MRPLIDSLLSRWSISLVGVALLAGLAWFFGPLLPGFEDWLPRLAIVLGLLLAWALVNALLDAWQRRLDSALTRGLVAGSADETEEAQALAARLTRALDL